MVRGIELDWVVIRINTIRRIVAIGLTLVAAAVLLVLVNHQIHPSPEVAASRAIRRAEKAQQRAAETEIPKNWKMEVKQAAGLIKEARAAYADEDFQLAEQKARGARSRFEALSGVGDRSLVGEGQFHTVHGKVEIQRAGKSGWESAELKAPVFNGDFIKTGNDGTTEILFSDGALFKVSPNSLLEVHRRGKEARDRGSVKMVVGRVNVITGQSRSIVSTDNVDTQIDTDSRVALNVRDGREETIVSAFSGSALLRDSKGKKLQVGTREQVHARRDSGFSEKEKIPQPPTHLAPTNNTGFDIAGSRIIRLKWVAPPRSIGTRLQVSRFPDFPVGDLDVDSPVLRGTTARLEMLHPGSYYWRLATVFGEESISEWSTPHRFRIYSRERHQIIRDLEPPALHVASVRQLGHLCIVEGKTEAGSEVQINGNRVDVDASGNFNKMVEVHSRGWTTIVIQSTDPSGNTSEKRRKVYLEEF